MSGSDLVFLAATAWRSWARASFVSLPRALALASNGEFTVATLDDPRREVRETGYFSQ